MENLTVNEGKTEAIISHFTIIGLIIAFVLNMNKKMLLLVFTLGKC